MPGTFAITDGLTEAQMLELEDLLVGISISPGRSLLDEGQPAPGLYLVDAGRITVQKRDMGGHQQTITTLTAPALVGELEVLTGEPCAATVIAVEPVLARLLRYAAFDQLLSRGDTGAVRLLRNLARSLGHKLLATDEVYVDMAIWR
jgi:CRP-like cAMP-binding protein